MAGEMIEVTSRDGFVFGAYHATPAGARKGGVIVVQEIFGLSAHIKAMADRFAAEGYEAIAPSMYDRAEPGYVVQPDEIEGRLERSVELAVGNGPENAVNDMGACFDLLKDRGPVFVTGYCYGGTMSWLAAARVPGIAAASCYYGGNIADMAGMELGCPVECHFGRNDPHIPVEKVEALKEKRPDVPVFLYDAGHGFARKNSSDYDEASDNLAFERTLKLFAANAG